MVKLRSLSFFSSVDYSKLRRKLSSANFWYSQEYDATDMSLDFLMLENSLASSGFGDTKPDSILFFSSSSSKGTNAAYH